MFFRFILVGGLGFFIDAYVTYLLIQLMIAPWIARIPAIVIAMTFTWIANRNFTYKVKNPRSTNEAIRYAFIAVFMASFNYLIYLFLVGYGISPVVSVTMATACQTLISFHAYRYFVFIKPTIKMTKTSLNNASPGSQNNTKSITQKPWLYDVIAYMIALAILTIAMMHLHALDSGLSGSDEGSHFLNSYLIWSYLTEAIGKNPLSYAQDFYIHYPKISIGHWPPLYYSFLSLFFFILPHAPWPFLIINMLVGALPALLIARVIRKALGLQWAIVSAVIYVMIPIVLNNTIRLMLDQALASLCLLAAFIWSSYAKETRLRQGIVYAIVTSAAILIKGNGWLLGVFPLFHIILTGNWRLLLNWRTYVSGIFALLIVGIWTIVTYKISSDGFNYDFGVDYFVLAISNFLPAIYSNLGFLGSIFVFIGILGSFYYSKKYAALKEVVTICLSLILATIIFHSIIPVDLDARYMSSAIPPLIILMVIGLWIVSQRIQWTANRQLLILTFITAIFSIQGILFLNARPTRFDMHMDIVANEVTSNPNGMVIVIDGNSGSEGALTAEVAIRDFDHKNYVVRSSQLLAKSDFMGHQYTLKVDKPESVLNLLDEISCNAIVIADGPFIEPRFAHSDLLLSAIKLPSSQFQLKKVYEHDRHKGKTYLFIRNHYVYPQQTAIRQVNFPEKSP